MNPTNSESISIQPINKNTVHQICSGQVVLNLATAVKELLENSLDAGATTIQIKLEEYGSESIEVIDNGCGVEDANFQALTLKHHTSKITGFNDLCSVETFGFRGEALSSLCALSDVTIVTQHKNAEIGASLKFNHQGIIISNTKIFRKVGTTVKVENLFCTLPVRRVEFIKNLKREFSKMCNILYAYGLQSVGVRIKCTNQVLKHKISSKDNKVEMVRKGAATIMDTKGDSVISNIRAIFGIKQGQNLMQIIEKLPGSATLSEFGLENEVLDAERFKLDGYISSCAHGCGRAASDRQFYYINMRPVDNPKIGKLVNEMYHQFNNHQAPFVILNIKIAFGSFDVNVTPDKRQILIQNEKILLAILKESLISTFQNIPSTLEMQNVGILKHESKEEIGCIEKLKTNYTFSASQQSKRGESDRRIDKLLSLKLKSEITLTSKKRAALANSDKDDKVDDNENISFIIPHNEIRISDKQNAIVHVDIPRPLPGNLKLYIKTESCKKDNFSEQTRHTKMPFENNNEIKRKLPSPQIFDVSYKEEKLESEEIESKRMKFDLGLSENEKNHRTTVILDVNLNGLTEMILKKKEQNERESKKNELMKFHAQIKRQSNEKAESELKRQIKKESFAQMEIIGQFNLGFIIVKLDTDIFVVDQHASDEKYNFETMRSNTVMQTQKMVVPETLELTVDKEELMVHRELVFKKNGFEFVFDETAVPTRRIKLTSIPLSKNVSFGKEDIDELLFLLEDAPEKVMLRPSRVESMFASRACRKSVMVGTPLNHNEMKKIVCQMGDIEQPWNCPHGRPTMRHLVNLGMIYTEK